MNTYTQNIKIKSSNIRRPPVPRVYQQGNFNTPEPGMPYEQTKFYAPQGLSTNPEPQKKSSALPFLIIFIVILVVITVALIFAFKDKIFKKGATLASAPPAEQSDAGYGTYGPPIVGLCKTPSGLCSDIGSQTITQQCIPNPITNLGCLDKDGNQTFSPKVSNQNCNIPCRQFKFVETTRNPNIANNDFGTYDSVCKYYPAGQEGLPDYNDVSLYPCLPNNEKIGQYFVKRNTCLPNDKIGTNECSVTCGEIDYKPNGFTTSPVEDPNSVLYIPVCDRVLQAGIYNKPLASRHFYLNTFPWDIAFNLPQNGVIIGKGYKIKNLIDPATGAIDLNKFSIEPSYASPYDSNGNLIDDSSIPPSPTITVKQLEDLDSNLYTYQSCEVKNQRPYCGKYYMYSRTQYTPNVGINETPVNINTATTPPTIVYTKPSLDPPINSFRAVSNGQIFASRNCYYNNHYSSISLNRFQTPYDYTYIPSSNTDYYSGGYSGYGIGMFGYTNDELNCLTSVTAPTQESPDQANAYNVPPSNGLCLALTSLSDLTSPVSSYPVPANDLISTNCFPLDTSGSNPDLRYLPEYLPKDTDYPPTSGIYNTCNTQIAYQQAPTGSPGILSICRYMPNNEDITPRDSLIGLPDKFKQLLGYYIRLGITHNTTDTYYLTLQNTPCDCVLTSPATDYTLTNCKSGVGSNMTLNEPLGNCNGNPNNFGVGPIQTMLVYNGSTSDSFSGGVFWERPGCDSFMMNAVNSLQLIISPQRYDSINDRLECDILCVFMGSYNGYLSYEYEPLSSPTYAKLVYIPLKPGDIHPEDYYYYNGNQPVPALGQSKFAITCVSSTSPATYTIKAYDDTLVTPDYTLDVRIPTFDGTAPPDITSSYLDLTTSINTTLTLYEINGNPTTQPSDAVFKDSNLIPFNPYYVKLLGGKYEAQPIFIGESGGLYPNINKANDISTQQNTCVVGTQTCNLFCSY